jgi:endonuclease/exonuclease/phosphatase family metal-dependent hydrolase
LILDQPVKKVDFPESLARDPIPRNTAVMRSSKLFVAIVVVVIVGVALFAVSLRRELRCVGFAGPGVSAAELPSGPAGDGRLRIAHFNLRNYPLDERPQTASLGFSRRTNICDLEDVLAGLDAQVFGFAEVCDRRRLPPILRRAGGGRPMRILYSQGGGRGGQHLAVAWDAERVELVDGPVEIDGLIVKPGLRPGLAVRLMSLRDREDFTVIQVHLDAGIEDLDHRLEQVRFLAGWVDDWVKSVNDPDVILQGDFNTMGSRHVRPAEELRRIDSILAGSGLRRVANATGCTQYWEGLGPADGVHQASLLDHVYVRGLKTVGPARSWLHCERARCGELVSRPGEEDGTFWDVSDHCPVTVEIADRR